MSYYGIAELLELSGLRYVIEENMGLWVKFDVKSIVPTPERPHGIRYSLSLHNRENQRLLGFDNAHSIAYGAKVNVAPKVVFDHWHKNESDPGRPYHFTKAVQLLEDFWNMVDKKILELNEVLYEC